MRKSRLRLAAEFDAQNAEAARIILQDIAKYGGEGSGPVRWARLVMARLEPERAAASRKETT